MAKTILTTLILAAILALAACSDDPQEPAPEPGPVGSLVDASGCKNKDGHEDPPVLPTDRGFLFWSYNADTGLLRVNHVNAGLNCSLNRFYRQRNPWAYDHQIRLQKMIHYGLTQMYLTPLCIQIIHKGFKRFLRFHVCTHYICIFFH